VTLAGSNPGQFTRTHDCGDLVANRTCTVNVVFNPTSAGAKSAVLRVTSDAVTRESTLSGSGVSAGGFAVTPTNIAFGNQLKNASSAPRSVQVQNTGSGALTINSISLSGAQAGQFSRTSSCGTTLAAGASCQVNVVFTPQGTGARSATLVVAAGGTGSKRVALTGTGVDPSFTLTPTSITFGNQPRNTNSAPQVVTLTNTTPGVLQVAARSLRGSNPGQFLQTSTCGATIAPGATCSISVVFRPTSAGAKSATLTVRGGNGAGSHSVALSGSGT
jgi:hypothetical protein